MIKRMILIIVSLVMIFAFAGCQLAEESKGTETNTDALCGMFITLESLYSEEDYFDNIDWGAALSGGKQMYQAEKKPIYATEKVNPEFGDKEYYFEGIEGIRMMEVLVPADGEHEEYYMTCADTLFLDDVESGISYTNTGTEITLKGTLYVYPGQMKEEDGNLSLYCNPVYETSDGKIYTVPANCSLGINTDAGIEDSTTLSSNTTLTINNEEQSWTAEIKLKVVDINNINKYILKEMDTQDNVISVTEITENSIPAEIKLDGNAAYAILEEHSADISGNAVIERSIIKLETESLDVRFPNEKGFALTHRIPLKNVSAKPEEEKND